MNIRGPLVCILLGYCILTSSAIIDDVLNILQGIALEVIADCSELSANSSLILFKLYTPDNPIQPVIYSGSDVGPSIDQSRETKFIIHGWIESSNQSWVLEMKNAYLNVGYDYNVVAVDWYQYSGLGYAESVCYVPTVGQVIAEFIVRADLDLTKVHLIGHSMGGQVSSYVGQTVNFTQGSKLDRITGLDAAGPLYCSPVVVDANERLTADDANFVDAIHTNGGVFGCAVDYGTADFRPNCGSQQPGCVINSIGDIVGNLNISTVWEDVFCNHHRSYMYFIESIYDNCFEARQCRNCLAYYTDSLCSGGSVADMGECCPRNANGDYYLRTNSEWPYCTT